MKTTKILMLMSLLIMTSNIFSQNCKKSDTVGKHLINTDEAGNNIAMEGYDLISFFNQKPTKGNKTNASTYEGITYLFSSEANKNKFDKEPTKFMPQYGGFCAVAMYFGKAEELQTYDLYDVVDDKLYFNKNEKAKKLWDSKGAKKVIKKSDKKWNCVLAKLGLDINEPYVEPKSIK